MASKSLDEIVDNDIDALEAELDEMPEENEFADAFRFEAVGDKLVGRVVATGTIENKYGEYPVLTVERNGELVALHGLGTILKRELAKAEVGQLVAVRYQGEKDAKDGGTYKDYKVVIRKG